MRKITSATLKDVLCCLISADDFPKAFLLANIAKEEGVGYSEIRIPFDAKISDFKLYSKVKGKVILSIDPEELGKVASEKKEQIGQAQSLLADLTSFNPFGLELNYTLSRKFIQETIAICDDEKIATIVAKYFDHFPNQEEIETMALELMALDCSIMKIVIPVTTKYQALEVLAYHKLFEKEKVIIVCSGEKGKIAQLLAPFYGSVFTYGYLSKENNEAMTSISYLKNSIDAIITMR